ncbi:MAG: methionine synthase [Lentisphaeria bacterium]|nr:methionine synthase [Lentisphaeria bacterium]
MNHNCRSALLRECLKQRILILDGAMGTMLQSFHPEEADFRGEILKDHPVPLKGNNDVLGLTRPELPRNVHRMYLEAGADIIETNTFNSNKVSQEEYQLSHLAYDLAFAGTRNARAEADLFTAKTPEKPRFVAGSIGPTSKTLSMSPDVSNPAYRDLTFDDMVAAYRPAVEGMLDGGADMLLIETIFDTLNAKAAVYAAIQVFEERNTSLPIMFSGTVSDSSGRLLAGQNVEAFLISVLHTPDLLSIGFNCALGAAEMRPHIEELAGKAPYFVSAHPNAGLPDENGCYTQTPAEMAKIIAGFAKDGLLNIVGGCCGTNPDYIRAIAEAVKGFAPRMVPEIPKKLRLSGLDPVVVSDSLPFLNIGERANVAGSRKFLNLMKAEDYPAGLRICRSQVENGAQVLDINMDDALLDSEKVMNTFLLNLASDPDIARAPLMIDSSRWEVLRGGLARAQGKCIVNSLSLKEGEAVFLEKAKEARKFGAAILAMAFDENGQADTVERRVEVCRRMYKLLTEQANVPPEDIIFDPNVFAVATGMPEHDRCAIDFIDAVRQIKQEMPLCTISGGLSNVSFSFRGNEPVRRALHSVFLYHGIRAGLGMAIVNAAQLDIYDDIEPGLRAAAEAVILNTSPDAAEKLLAIAAGLKNEAGNDVAEKTPRWRLEPVEKRLSIALVRGDDAYLQQDLEEAMAEYQSAVKLIEGPLMDGMCTAGQLFGEGKMFLPQVVKTARTMKRAVEILTPYLEDANAGVNAGTIVLATVKGDVHDIGKNIVSVILRCNGFRVIDLGVMVPCDSILEAIRKEKPDAVALSGLITPSLAEMEYVAERMEAEGMNIPLFVGGATTSKEHTALHIQPKYSGPCVQTCDASEIIPAMKAALSDRENFCVELNKTYQEILAAKANTRNTLPRKRATVKTQVPSPAPAVRNTQQLTCTIQELQAYIDWKLFYHIWNVKGKTPESEEAKKQLRADGETMLAKLQKQNALTPKAVWGIFPAESVGETVSVYDETRQNILEQIIFPRTENGSSLADFIAEKDDYCGMFCVTVDGADSYAAADEYEEMLCKTLAECLAEAFAEKLHQQIRTQDWGYAADEKWTLDDLFAGKPQGIRAAPGYPVCPDHALKRPLFRLLQVEEKLGASLTETNMIMPNASVCAYMFASENSFYF